jgi:hypothetical protein
MHGHVGQFAVTQTAEEIYDKFKRVGKEKRKLQELYTFFKNTVQHRRSQIRTYTHPYEHFRRTEPADLKVDKVTISTSLLTGKSPTTKRISPGNSGINPGNANAHTKSKN